MNKTSYLPLVVIGIIGLVLLALGLPLAAYVTGGFIGWFWHDIASARREKRLRSWVD